VPDPASAVLAWLMTPGVVEPPPTLEEIVHRPAWMAQAQCRGEDRAVFFPSVGTNAAKAKALCAICPVRQPCLDYAAADAEIGGIWGTTDRERRGMRGDSGRGIVRLPKDLRG
jgi:WhiB family transcriptional regulator, redox-sensing transcriptional regulator